MASISDKDVAYYATFITGHPEAEPDPRHLAATRAVLEGLAKGGRLGYPPVVHEEIRRLLYGTGHEVDELDDRLAAGYTLRDAVTSALAAYDRRGELARAIEFRALRSETVLRHKHVPIPTERDGIWRPCTPELLERISPRACALLPRRDADNDAGHEHWTYAPLGKVSGIHGPDD